nr:hypothetical protein [Rubrobacteraceae bacterium]
PTTRRAFFSPTARSCSTCTRSAPPSAKGARRREIRGRVTAGKVRVELQRDTDQRDAGAEQGLNKTEREAKAREEQKVRQEARQEGRLIRQEERELRLGGLRVAG